MMQRPGFGVIAIVCASVSVASAQPAPPADAWQQQRLAAEKLETEARAANDFAKFAACGKAYLDLYNGNLKAAGADEVLYNAAVCFDSGKSVGAALQAIKLLRKSFPTSKLIAKATLREGAMYARIGSYPEAATTLEEYARKYAGEKDAAAALSDALYYRMTFGPDAKALDDANLASKLYGAKRPAETADAMFALIGLHERRGGGEPLITHLRDYLKKYAQSGGAERAVLVTVKLGETLWHKACPVPETDGLCVKITRERPALKVAKQVTPAKLVKSIVALPKQCGDSTTPNVVVVARDAARTTEALALFATAIKQVEARGAAADPGSRSVTARARLYAHDKSLETYLTLKSPRGLNFDPAKKAIAAASLKAFNGWVEQKIKLGSTMTAGYEGVLATKDASASIAAAARLGQVSMAFADSLHTAEIPVDVRTGEFADEKTGAFCDKMAEVAEPLEKRAEEAFLACRAKSTELGVFDSFTRLCERESWRIDPKHAVHEEFATPSDPIATTVELPIRSNGTLSAAFQAALTKVAETEKIGWTPPACRANAAQFAAIVKANPTFTDVQYMVGLSFHRCGLVDDARRAYEQTTKLRADHAAAHSNLAELQWRAGNRDAAKRGWEAALAIDAKLYAAHVNLAAAAIGELRALPEKDTGRTKLADGARLHLQSALAVDDADPAAYVAFASLEAGRPAVESFFVAESTKRAQKQLGPVLLAGAVDARRERWGAAAVRYKVATTLDPTSSDAQFGLALVQMRLRQWDAARATLALVKVPSYDHQIATGVTLRVLGKRPEALAAFDKAIALAPNRAEGYFNVGLLHVLAAGEADLAAQKVPYGKAVVAFRRAADFATGALKIEAKLQADQIDKTLLLIDQLLKSQAVPPVPVRWDAITPACRANPLAKGC